MAYEATKWSHRQGILPLVGNKLAKTTKKLSERLEDLTNFITVARVL